MHQYYSAKLYIIHVFSKSKDAKVPKIQGRIWVGGGPLLNVNTALKYDLFIVKKSV